MLFSKGSEEIIKEVRFLSTGVLVFASALATQIALIEGDLAYELQISLVSFAISITTMTAFLLYLLMGRISKEGESENKTKGKPMLADLLAVLLYLVGMSAFMVGLCALFWHVGPKFGRLFMWLSIGAYFVVPLLLIIRQGMPKK